MPTMTLTVDSVNDILRAMDPERLIADGAPADEYISEAQALTKILRERPVREADVVTVWIDWFGESARFLGAVGMVGRSDLVRALNALRL